MEVNKYLQIYFVGSKCSHQIENLTSDSNKNQIPDQKM